MSKGSEERLTKKNELCNIVQKETPVTHFINLFLHRGIFKIPKLSNFSVYIRFCVKHHVYLTGTTVMTTVFNWLGSVLLRNKSIVYRSTVKLTYGHKCTCTQPQTPSEAVSLTASPSRPNQYWPWKVTRSHPLSGIIHQRNCGCSYNKRLQHKSQGKHL